MIGVIQKIRKLARNNLLIRKLIAFYLVPTGLFDKVLLNKPLDKIWQERLNITLSSPDNKYINRVKNAGEVVNGKQIMHNGIIINLGSYYGPEVARILKENKGVHEPQEERVFQELLKVLPENGTMIELGAFWGFYSMWFKSKITYGINYLIEPDSFNLLSGKLNFKLNSMSGNFHQYYVSDIKDEKLNQINIDSFKSENNISTIHILHSDIQGYELKMLEGAEGSLADVWFVFISTHSNELHAKCQEFLSTRGFSILCSINKDETFSEDGLIVAQNPNINLLESIDLSKRTNFL